MNKQSSGEAPQFPLTGFSLLHTHCVVFSVSKTSCRSIAPDFEGCSPSKVLTWPRGHSVFVPPPPGGKELPDRGGISLRLTAYVGPTKTHAVLEGQFVSIVRTIVTNSFIHAVVTQAQECLQTVTWPPPVRAEHLHPPQIPSCPLDVNPPPWQALNCFLCTWFCLFQNVPQM